MLVCDMILLYIVAQLNAASRFVSYDDTNSLIKFYDTNGSELSENDDATGYSFKILFIGQ